MSTAEKVWSLLGWLALTALAAATGAVASTQAPEFYYSLTLPAWAPPASLFGPVWSVLYFMMAVAVWLVWCARGWATGGALLLYLAQLTANTLWSWLFFALHRGAWAFADITLLWLLILATTIAFWKIRPAAGTLLLPYLAWVTFAAALNYKLCGDIRPLEAQVCLRQPLPDVLPILFPASEEGWRRALHRHNIAGGPG